MENYVAANTSATAEQLSYDNFRNEVLKDYRTACVSREASLMGRREVLTGKAKFGIFGDGKEVAQVAMAKFFKPGDWRSGYYRDQTWMMALGHTNAEEFFAQLYSDPDPAHDPMSAGRQMNSHYTSLNYLPDGTTASLVNQYNTATDMAPTAGQMPRSLGLAHASKAFRQVDVLKQFTELSNNGNEVCFASIGDASTSEGHFWETINAAGVLQVPLAVFVYDDGYGISVPKKQQTTKASISEALSGLQKEPGTNGIHIYKVKAWDYAGMCEAFEQGITHTRNTHEPVLFHIEEVTQPQGHSTSGSHERYKSPERLEWEREWDGLKKMKEWILANALSSEEELEQIETGTKNYIRESKQKAWAAYQQPVQVQVEKTLALLDGLVDNGADLQGKITAAAAELKANREPMRRDVMKALAAGIDFSTGHFGNEEVNEFYNIMLAENRALFNDRLYSNTALDVPVVKADVNPLSPVMNGYEVLNKYFDQLFASNPKVLAFGEDLGHIGDVNQGFAGLQEKHGKERIFDTGIRELTIMGQGIGLALRGLRPIAEIQYLDYLLYGLQPLSDDVASLHYRTRGKQSCPIIVRTRGHRLEGIWHSGSPMQLILGSLRGFYVCVPRNMVQAAGMYNTLLQASEPAIMIECLNGYRLKEQLPGNLQSFTVPMGIPEVIREGADITIVSYGSTLRIVMDAAKRLAELGINAEVVDVQTLLPFDINHKILESLKKTSRILFVDEDVPGGAAGFMFTEVMEKQGGYKWLDASPRTLTAQAHRPSYGSDGDYFSKPNVEDVVRVVKEMMQE